MRHKPIKSKLFSQNRKRIAELMAPKALAVLNANDVLPTNADGTLPMEPNADLFFLSGIEQEESVLLLFPDAAEEKHREILFAPPPSPPDRRPGTPGSEKRFLSNQSDLGRIGLRPPGNNSFLLDRGPEPSPIFPQERILVKSDPFRPLHPHLPRLLALQESRLEKGNPKQPQPGRVRSRTSMKLA